MLNRPAQIVDILYRNLPPQDFPIYDFDYILNIFLKGQENRGNVKNEIQLSLEAKWGLKRSVSNRNPLDRQKYLKKNPLNDQKDS